MINLAISIAGDFYRTAITEALEETGNFRVFRMTGDGGGRPPELRDEWGKLPNWKIALLGISPAAGFTLKERRSLIDMLRRELPDCRIVLFLDEYAAQNQTEEVKTYRQAGLIDDFVYASGTMGYLIAKLEST